MQASLVLFTSFGMEAEKRNWVGLGTRLYYQIYMLTLSSRNLAALAVKREQVSMIIISVTDIGSLFPAVWEETNWDG